MDGDKEAMSGWPGLFRKAFARSRSAMLLVDERLRIVDANATCAALLGHQRDTLVRHRLVELLDGRPPLSQREWRLTIARGDFTGSADLVRRDGGAVRIRYVAYPDALVRLVLFVGLHVAKPAVVGVRPAAALSARELEIVRLVARGGTGPQIAEQLHVSHHTVRAHIAHAMGKLGARSRAQLVAMTLNGGGG